MIIGVAETGFHLSLIILDLSILIMFYLIVFRVATKKLGRGFRPQVS